MNTSAGVDTCGVDTLRMLDSIFLCGSRQIQNTEESTNNQNKTKTNTQQKVTNNFGMAEDLAIV